MRSVMIALVLAVVPASATVPAAGPAELGSAAAPGREALADVVAARLPAGDGAVGTDVTVLRQRPDGWAFGTAVRLAPSATGAYPDGWLWVARAGQDRWRIEWEGTAGFAALSRRAPVLAPAEQAVLGALAGPAEATATDYRTGMRLPYEVGQAWRYTGGPHPMSGGVRSSIDLAGGDGRVRAARAGVAYTMCGSGTGWLRVVHDRGFATDYYHLEGAISADGRRVAEGEVLGRIGNDVSCGGRSTGAHVHFSLRRHGEYIPIHRYAFGKWSIRAGAEPYQGAAWHGSTRVGVGGELHNYGALKLTEGVVDTDGGGVLNRRAGPGTDHPVVGTIPDGATVRVRCSARGTTHTGRGGYTSDLWNRLAGGGWVSDVFLWTGTGAPVNGWCG